MCVTRDGGPLAAHMPNNSTVASVLDKDLFSPISGTCLKDGTLWDYEKLCIVYEILIDSKHASLKKNILKQSAAQKKGLNFFNLRDESLQSITYSSEMDNEPCKQRTDAELLTSEVTEGFKESSLETDLGIQKSTGTLDGNKSETLLLQVISILESLDSDITNSLKISRKDMYLPKIPGLRSRCNSITEEETGTVAESALSITVEETGTVAESALSITEEETGTVAESALSITEEETGTVAESALSITEEETGTVAESALLTTAEETGTVAESALSTTAEETGTVAESALSTTAEETGTVAESALSTTAEETGTVAESALSTTAEETGTVAESALSTTAEETGTVAESALSTSAEGMGTVAESALLTSAEGTGTVAESALSTSPEKIGTTAKKNTIENSTVSACFTCLYFGQMDNIYKMQQGLLVIRRDLGNIVKELLVHCNSFKSCACTDIEYVLDEFNDILKEREDMEKDFEQGEFFQLISSDAIGAIRLSSQMMYYKYLLLENDKYIQTFKLAQFLMTRLMRGRICLQKEEASSCEMKEMQ
ncbi:hypothetical protein TNCT_32042 [Trichonephila clavata]|uniref:Uncharacterized protein n=1 Tax=Trichonephila clavata TaxID=2740835 RepID=A0A8X6HMR8_TRICU|nr:hypothetical protein TNCT_32042 [Trichonephila clavata]